MKNKENSNTSALKRFFPYMTKYKVENFSAIILGIVSGISSVYITKEIGHAIDQMMGVGKVNFSNLAKISILFLILVVVLASTQWLIKVLGNRVAYLSVGDLRKDTFSHLNDLPLSYYDSTPHGDITSRFTNDMDNISLAVSSVYNQVFSGLAIIIIALITMLRSNLILTAVVLLSTPIIFIVSWLVAKSSQENFSKQQEMVGQISSFISERVGNQKIVVAFEQEKNSQEIFEKLNNQLYDKGQKAQFSSSLTNPSSRFVDHLAYVAVGFTGAYLILVAKADITVGLISSFTIYASQFTKPFIEISGIITPVQTGLAGIVRAFSILDQKPETPDVNLPQLNQVTGKVAFENVDFAYVPSQPLIRDFNFSTQPGEKIAIVGKTGAGKSTLVNLLMRFYDVDAGEVSVDGHDIRQVTRDSLRSNFGMVLQDTWLFDGTIRENLTYGNADATDEEIYKVLKESYMFEFVDRLPKKLNTRLGEHGVKISQGQAQLLTIARTMLSKPKMLILDEATSSVDSLTESKIQDAFLKMMEGKTSFIIAHRLSTIRNADKILVMDKGQIVEIGNHEELLKKQGAYYDIYKAQFAS
ncbi:ABC transporter ATP-binding protein [Floricoccus penangensis]|uniref:ABC transporter ATP-binding protein n=1 Tax=Floricoccus penangensis TaxID=1859475 RepID=UPI00203CE9FC|nr:ABC transporter ATP-binding protein [Floricoccus penangensis]URZ88123.1 ABC transporter ATP-binding protein/permease [Floricoccus penangensis]